jgi:hypothetical protein
VSARHLNALMKAIVKDGYRLTETYAQFSVLMLLAYHQSEDCQDLTYLSKEKLGKLMGWRPGVDVGASPRNLQRVLGELTNDLRIVRRYDVGSDYQLYELVAEPGAPKGVRRIPTGVSVRQWDPKYWRPGLTHRFRPPIRRQVTPQLQGRAEVTYVLDLPIAARVSPPETNSSPHEWAGGGDEFEAPQAKTDPDPRPTSSRPQAKTGGHPETPASPKLCIELGTELCIELGTEHHARVREAAASPHQVVLPASPGTLQHVREITREQLERHGLTAHEGQTRAFVNQTHAVCRERGVVCTVGDIETALNSDTSTAGCRLDVAECMRLSRFAPALARIA